MRSEAAAYWTVFVITFLLVAVWESFRPRKELTLSAERRWSAHGLLLLAAMGLQMLVLRMSPVVMALQAANNPYGLLNREWMPVWAQWTIAMLALDLWQYAFHRACHGIGWLWRIHEAHHSDADYDVTTGVRFHPIEVVFRQAGAVGLTYVLAPPAAAVLAAELLTVVLNFLQHANAALPAWAERAMRTVFITPDLHRLHHSMDEADQRRNLGQAWVWWDILFGSYEGRKDAGGLRTGLPEWPGASSLSLLRMLVSPFQLRSRGAGTGGSG